MHAPRRFRTGQFAPQNGAQVEAHQIIQSPPRQIGLDQFHIHLARVFHGLGHGCLGDGVKHHAADSGGFLDRLALGQRLLQMPRDRLALAVGVGCEDQCIVIFERIRDGFDVLF